MMVLENEKYKDIKTGKIVTVYEVGYNFSLDAHKNNKDLLHPDKFDNQTLMEIGWNIINDNPDEFKKI